jgi:hypothetical protein
VTFVYTAVNLRGFAAVNICHGSGHVCTSVSLLTSHASASKDGPGAPVSYETFFLFWHPAPIHHRRVGSLLHLIALNDTHTHTHTPGGTHLDEESVRRRDIYLTNTQHPQETENHAPGRIRTSSPSM